MTRSTWVCWSINSETKMRYGSRVFLQGRLSRLRPAGSRLRIEASERMRFAVMRVCLADIPSIEYQTVVHILPVPLGNERLEVFRNFSEIIMIRKVEPLRKALHVRVGGDAIVQTEKLAPNNVRSLVAYTRKRDEFLIPEAGEALGGRDDVFRFSAEERD